MMSSGWTGSTPSSSHTPRPVGPRRRWSAPHRARRTRRTSSTPGRCRKATRLALHAVDALDDDQNLVVSRTLVGDGVLEDELQVPDAVVLEGADFRAGETRALDDGVVVERVRNDEVAGVCRRRRTRWSWWRNPYPPPRQPPCPRIAPWSPPPPSPGRCTRAPALGAPDGSGVIADRLRRRAACSGCSSPRAAAVQELEAQASSRLRRR